MEEFSFFLRLALLILIHDSTRMMGIAGAKCVTTWMEVRGGRRKWARRAKWRKLQAGKRKGTRPHAALSGALACLDLLRRRLRSRASNAEGSAEFALMNGATQRCVDYLGTTTSLSDSPRTVDLSIAVYAGLPALAGWAAMPLRQPHTQG